MTTSRIHLEVARERRSAPPRAPVGVGVLLLVGLLYTPRSVAADVVVNLRVGVVDAGSSSPVRVAPLYPAVAGQVLRGSDAYGAGLLFEQGAGYRRKVEVGNTAIVLEGSLSIGVRWTPGSTRTLTDSTQSLSRVALYFGTNVRAYMGVRPHFEWFVGTGISYVSEKQSITMADRDITAALRGLMFPIEVGLAYAPTRMLRIGPTLAMWAHAPIKACITEKIETCDGENVISRPFVSVMLALETRVIFRGF